MKKKVIGLAVTKTTTPYSNKTLFRNISYIFSAILLSSSPIVYEIMKTKKDPRPSINVIIPKIISPEEGSIERENLDKMSFSFRVVSYSKEVMMLTYPYIHELKSISGTLKYQFLPIKNLEIYKNKIERIKTIFNELEIAHKKFKEKYPNILKEEYLKLLLDPDINIDIYSVETLPITEILDEIYEKNIGFFLQLSDEYDLQTMETIEATRASQISKTLKLLSWYGYILKVLEEKEYFAPQIEIHEKIAETTTNKVELNKAVSQSVGALFLFSLIGASFLYRNWKYEREQNFDEQKGLLDQIIKSKEQIYRFEGELNKTKNDLKNAKEKLDAQKNKLGRKAEKNRKLSEQNEALTSFHNNTQNELKRINDELKIMQEEHRKLISNYSSSKQLSLKLNTDAMDPVRIREILNPLANLFKGHETLYILEKHLDDKKGLGYLKNFFELLKNNKVKNIKLIVGTPDQYKVGIFNKIIRTLELEPNLEIYIVSAGLIHDRVMESEKGFVQLGRSLGQMYRVKQGSIATCEVTYLPKHVKENEGFRFLSPYFSQILSEAIPLSEWNLP